MARSFAGLASSRAATAVASALCSTGACFVDATGGDRAAGGGPSSTVAFMSGGGDAASSAGGQGGAGGSGGGCEPNCVLVPADACASAAPFLLPDDRTIVVTDTTAGATNDIEVQGFSGLDCSSRGVDVWFALRVATPGAVTVALRAGPGGNWGSDLDHAWLQLRKGCAPAKAGEVLVCEETPQGGDLEVSWFAHPGETYHLGVDGRDPGDEGPFELQITHTECGNGRIDPLEHCDSGPNPTMACIGCLFAAGAPDPCGIDDVDTASHWNASDNHCYVWEQGAGNANFFEARERCVRMGGDLASLENMAEHAILDAQCVFADAWVGLENFEMGATNVYEWLTGPPYAGPWVVGEPNNMETKPRCAFFVYDGGALSNLAEDAACDTDTTEFVCELRGANP